MTDLPGRTKAEYAYYSQRVPQPFPVGVTLFDDFLGDVVADQWNYVEGSDSTTADGAIVEGINGVFRLTGGDSAGSVAADGAELNSALGWKANQGGLTFEARILLASIASVSCFLGFTDSKSLEQAIYSAGSADTITTDATDAVGVFFDTAMATDNWWFAGVANDVDATKQDTALAPVASTYETFRIVIDVNGTATLYRATAAEPANFMQIGTPMANAVTPTVALTPVFFIRPKSAAAGKTMDIDYVRVSANRV
jgi:hypothetical protein